MITVLVAGVRVAPCTGVGQTCGVWGEGSALQM